MFIGAEYEETTSAPCQVQTIDMDELSAMFRKCSLHDKPEKLATGIPGKGNARPLSTRKLRRKVTFSPLNQRQGTLNAVLEKSNNVSPEGQHKDVKVMVHMESKTSPERSLKGMINLFQHADKREEEQNSYDPTDAKYTKICQKETNLNNTNNIINTGIAGTFCKIARLIDVLHRFEFCNTR